MCNEDNKTDHPRGSIYPLDNCEDGSWVCVNCGLTWGKPNYTG